MIVISELGHKLKVHGVGKYPLLSSSNILWSSLTSPYSPDKTLKASSRKPFWSSSCYHLCVNFLLKCIINAVPDTV